jgi:hypothetical protein
MVNKILEPDNIDKSIKLHQIHGPMPSLPGSIVQTATDVVRVFAFEEDLQNDESSDAILNTLERWYHDYGSSYFYDWAKVLASARLRKLGLKVDANKTLATTEFTGYSFNTKGKN